MPFAKGKGKTGGRKKGVTNKKTVLLDAFAKSVCEGGAEKFQREMLKLVGKDFVYAYLALFEYVMPKLNRTEAKVEVKDDLDLTKLSPEELKTLLILKQKMSA